MFSYTVRCEIADAAVADSWLNWLVSKHVADVLQAGALSAEIFELEPGTFEIRYRFESEDAFRTYERDHAPALRLEGLQKFPLELGLSYSRSTGRCLHRFNC